MPCHHNLPVGSEHHYYENQVIWHVQFPYKFTICLLIYALDSTCTSCNVLHNRVLAICVYDIIGNLCFYVLQEVIKYSVQV